MDADDATPPAVRGVGVLPAAVDAVQRDDRVRPRAHGNRSGAGDTENGAAIELRLVHATLNAAKHADDLASVALREQVQRVGPDGAGSSHDVRERLSADAAGVGVDRRRRADSASDREQERDEREWLSHLSFHFVSVSQ